MLSSLLLVKKEKTKSLHFWYFSCLSVSIWTLTQLQLCFSLKWDIFKYFQVYTRSVLCPPHYNIRRGHCTDKYCSNLLK